MAKRKPQLETARLQKLRELAFTYADWFLRRRKWKTEANAVRALNRKQPKYSSAECEAAFKDGMALYNASIAFVQENMDTLHDRWRAIPASNDKCAAMMRVDDLIGSLHDRVPGFPLTTYESAIQGVFFFWHVL